MHPFIPASLAVVAVAAVALTLHPFVVTAAPAARPSAPATPTVGEPQERVAPPPPQALTDAVRVARVRQVSRPTLTLPPKLEMRVTPMAPSMANGTRITVAENIAFVGARSDQPDGVYWLLGDDPYNLSYVKMRVHTDKGSLYVADCRMNEVDLYGFPITNKVRVTAPGISQEYTASDGHLLFAFYGEASGSTVELKYRDASEDRYHAMLFYGCEFGKAL